MTSWCHKWWGGNSATLTQHPIINQSEEYRRWWQRKGRCSEHNTGSEEKAEGWWRQRRCSEKAPKWHVDRCPTWQCVDRSLSRRIGRIHVCPWRQCSKMHWILSRTSRVVNWCWGCQQSQLRECEGFGDFFRRSDCYNMPERPLASLLLCVSWRSCVHTARVTCRWKGAQHWFGAAAVSFFDHTPWDGRDRWLHGQIVSGDSWIAFEIFCEFVWCWACLLICPLCLLLPVSSKLWVQVVSCIFPLP